MLLQILLVVLLALCNGFFALSEMALMTARRSRLKQFAEERRGARAALELVGQPERFLAAMRLFVVLLQVTAGAALGADIGAQTAAFLAGVPALHAIAPAVGIGLAIAGIVVLNMLLGELAPKRLALANPEWFAMAVALPVRVLSSLARPVAAALVTLSRALLRALRLPVASREQVSEEEIRLLVAEGVSQGVIDLDESNMMNRVLRLGDRSVDSVMTPRTRVAWLDAADPVEVNLATMRQTPYSRYPVCRGDEQEVLGVLEVKRIIGGIGGDVGAHLFDDLAEPLYVPATARALDLLAEFRDAHTPLALVVDEYGDIEGVVTLNDLLSAVVGQGAGPSLDTDAQAIVQCGERSWLVDGSVGADDLRELLDLRELPNEDEHDFNTAAGMLMAGFGRIPQVGEHFTTSGFRFEVADMDGPRIDRLRISATGEAPPGGD
ncbi:MAG: HlyC/CorC family transporter [Xanthomonadales bacterium]|nr:HlyC/CorC family transporter [Xanthomonadales bacterium]